MSKSSKDFDTLLNSTEKPIFVLFSATWCAPCNTIKPIFSKESENNTSAVFVVVDIDLCQDITIIHKITKIPLIKVFLKNNLVDEASNVDQFKKLLIKYDYPENLNKV
jgi:thioredoxin-like negative regulator of GroEL